MKAIIFNGTLEKRSHSTAGQLSSYILQKLNSYGVDAEIFHLSDASIPHFNTEYSKTPIAVKRMNQMFTDADMHFWLAPLYHGSIPGVMKNCLDWLEISARLPKPYLTDKTVGLVCWADGVQAMQGINAMDAIAKSLRAWTLPFSVPIVRASLFEQDNNSVLSKPYQDKLDRLINISISRKINVTAI
ncbi:NADPH-dependent FMN reductase [Polluticaenibacter yanchengensis]|uniref:NAD(P)H-dependent oxidoreductase n=1 Tax=Polluticaenibacter yanchengensis TaxID=3014562 RepID=A0ABT4UJE1_9BACT|nr:NAD(P)H-dependent oxidoreductase [Chitinophagaceae bacterium LY-5]